MFLGCSIEFRACRPTAAIVPAFREIQRHLGPMIQAHSAFRLESLSRHLRSRLSNKRHLGQCGFRPLGFRRDDEYWSRHSCTIRNIESSISWGSRSISDGISSFTSTLLRSENPWTYQRSADAKTRSHPAGRMQQVGESANLLIGFLDHRGVFSNTFCRVALSLWVPPRREALFMLMAASSCPTLSCSSRAIRRRSSSCNIVSGR